jgi:thiamine biosynthesis lipoprotein
MNRRRLLTIAAAALLMGPGRARSRHVWTGRAMGADCRIVLSGGSVERARAAFRDVARVLGQTEARWSLFQDSDLARLNRTGRLRSPSPEVLALFRLAAEVNAATGGVFDPTVQPLWHALAEGRDPAPARALVGWSRVSVAEDGICLERGTEITMNGIAQGAAADAVAAVLAARGYCDVLIDTGEQVGMGTRPDGTPWRAAVVLPDGTTVAGTELAGTALATSAPLGTRIGPRGLAHILDPLTGRPASSWRLVSVMAPRAALADALSTAFTAMPADAIDRALRVCPQAQLVALVPPGEA